MTLLTELLLAVSALSLSALIALIGLLITILIGGQRHGQNLALPNGGFVPAGLLFEEERARVQRRNADALWVNWGAALKGGVK